jgi:hypothetical protein
MPVSQHCRVASDFLGFVKLTPGMVVDGRLDAHIGVFVVG